MTDTPKLTQADIDEYRQLQKNALSPCTAHETSSWDCVGCNASVASLDWLQNNEKALLDAAERGLKMLIIEEALQGDVRHYYGLSAYKWMSAWWERYEVQKSELDQLKAMVRELANIAQYYIDESECVGSSYEQCPNCLHVLSITALIKKARKLVDDE